MLKVAQSAHQQHFNNDDMSFLYQAAKFVDFGTEIVYVDWVTHLHIVNHSDNFSKYPSGLHELKSSW